MRAIRRLATTLLVVLLGPPGHAFAKDAFGFEFERRAYGWDERAVATGSLPRRALGVDGLVVFVTPLPRSGPGPGAGPGVEVEPVPLRVFREERWVSMRMAIDVPQLARGRYWAQVCLEPCPRAWRHSLAGAQLWIGPTSAEARLLWRLDVARGRLEIARGGGRLARGKLAAQLFAAEVQVDAALGWLRHEIEEGRRLRAELDELRAASPDGDAQPWVAWGIAAAAVALVAGVRVKLAQAGQLAGRHV